MDVSKLKEKIYEFRYDKPWPIEDGYVYWFEILGKYAYYCRRLIDEPITSQLQEDLDVTNAQYIVDCELFALRRENK